jgi:hypothetical protein
MKSLGLGRYALSICVAAAFLAGCGGSQPPLGAPGTMPQSPAIATHDDRSGSWMAKDATNSDLLYATNVSTVTVYSYPHGRHVGTLKGFYRPLGECADKGGDVFIADGDAIFEYAHGGTKPIQTLTLAGYLAESCASDPKTGNLAATFDYGDSKGYVAVYQNAAGTPTLYGDGKMLPVWCGYDDAGNLYADGPTRDSFSFRLAELPEGSSRMETITLDQSIGFPGAVQWDGKYLAVADPNINTIYRFAVSGSTGTLMGAVSLGNAQSVYEFWIDGKRVIGADDLPNTVWYWNYPAGGSPTKSITKDVFHPVGVTISKAPR